MEGYNGWKNRATWNVALYINNEYSLYCEARSYATKMKKAGKRISYDGFLDYAGLHGVRTPDGFKYDGTMLCRSELNEMLEELAS